MSEELRKTVARLALELQAGRMDFRSFLSALPREVESTADSQVAELLDLLEHQPAAGRLSGLSKRRMAEYQGRVSALIDSLQGS